MSTERRDFKSQQIGVETRADGGKTLTGYAATFYRDGDPGTEYKLWGDTYERIMPGAFDRAVAEDDVRALVNHDSSQIVGRKSAGTLRLSTDSRGLKYEIDLPDTTVGRDIAESVKRGDITGSSFGFMVDEQAWRSLPDGREIRELVALRLLDVGPVTFPAYEASSVAVRSLGSAKDEREQELKSQQAEKDAEEVSVRLSLIALDEVA